MAAAAHLRARGPKCIHRPVLSTLARSLALLSSLSVSDDGHSRHGSSGMELMTSSHRNNNNDEDDDDSNNLLFVASPIGLRIRLARCSAPPLSSRSCTPRFTPASTRPPAQEAQSKRLTQPPDIRPSHDGHYNQSPGLDGRTFLTTLPFIQTNGCCLGPRPTPLDPRSRC